VTVNAAANIPPTANAGNNITLTLPTNSTTLVGSGTDADGTIASYAWTKVTGPAAGTITSASSATTQVSGLVAGTYTFRLTVTDNSGATATDDMTVTVNAAANIAPTANAGSNITVTLPTNSTTLNGSGTDADGTIATYQWSYVSGPTTYTIATPASASTNLTNLVQGVYVFRLTVTDNSGATATDVVTVNVSQSTNQSPTANAGADITITLPTNTTTLYGSGTDPDGSIATYQWAMVSGPAGYTIANTTAATTGLYNLVQGVYVIRLTVTDNRGATATDNITVTVNAAPAASGNQPPTARTQPDITITLPTNSTQLHGNSSSDPDGVIAAYQWTQLSGPAASTVTSGTTSIATVSNLTTGIYTFELKVTDDKGATSTSMLHVTVDNPASTKALVKVYPNPAASQLTLQYVENANGKYRITIYDANRRLMRDETIDKTQVSITETFDVSSFNAGVYFIQISSSDNKSKTSIHFVKM
jgi:ribosomal protein L14